MYVRTVTLKRPSPDVAWITPTAAVQAHVQDYRNRGLLLDREVLFIDEYTVKDITTWASKSDFLAFWNDPVYVEYIRVASEYNEMHGVITTRSDTTIDSSNIVAS